MMLQLTITAVEDTLKNDNKGAIVKLYQIIDDLEAIHDGRKRPDVMLNEPTSKLLSGFIKLKKQNWGRISRLKSDSYTRRKTHPELDENYFMVRLKHLKPDCQEEPENCIFTSLKKTLV